MNLGTGRIRRLPTHLVNQIAAGEVIERPASVVKELVENSIDAGAVEVRVEIEEGGKRLIRVIDDGSGIEPEDLELALASHATSKIREETDLHSIGTLGFRGEALASIASVSELDILSRPEANESSARRVASNGEVNEGAPEWISPGTRITVQHLFSNVPARKRFLKSDRAEATRIRNVLREIALGTPIVGFTLINDGKTVFRFPAQQEPVKRVAEVLGADHTDKLLELKPIELPNRSLRGWIGRPDFFRRTNDLVYCFLNGRPVKDKVILHAVREGYSDFQIPGRYPAAVLLLDLDPSEVDVNVHPTKREVRFRDSSSVHRLVYRGVKDTLVAAGSVPDLLPPQRSAGGFTAPTERPAPAYPAIDRSAFGGESRGGGDPFGAPRGDAPPPSRVHDAEYPAGSSSTGASEGGDGHPARTPVEALPSRPLPEARELVDGRELRVVQMHNAYVMIEEPDGLRVIDQHALHEKILYEELLEARDRGVEKQPLLVPETVELTDREWEVFSEAQQPLADLGFEIEPFGESTVAIQAVPNGFDGRSTPALLRAALAKLGDALDHGAGTDVDLHESLIETMACKRAIKAGQKLTQDQLLDLVRGRARAFQPQNCPHGRAAELFLSWEELDRRFDRK